MYPSLDKNVLNTLAVQDDQNVNYQYVPACKRTYCTKRKLTRCACPLFRVLDDDYHAGKDVYSSLW